MAEKKIFYTPYDISQMLGISYQTALEWIKTSGIKYSKVGRKYLVSKINFNIFTQQSADFH